MFNIHFLPIILLCFFTKTAFWVLVFAFLLHFFDIFEVLNRKNSLKNNFYIKKNNKIRYYIKDLFSLPKDMKYGTF